MNHEVFLIHPHASVTNWKLSRLMLFTIMTAYPAVYHWLVKDKKSNYGLYVMYIAVEKSQRSAVES